MGENAAKPVKTNITFADVLMPVHVRAQRRFGIVGVNHVNVFEVQQSARLIHGLAQSGLAGDIISGGQQVARIQAESDG